MNMQRRLATTVVAATAVFVLAGCASTPMATSAPVSIADTAAKTPSLSTLNTLINQAGLADTLRGPGPFTVFAPTNEAFKAVPAKTMADLAANKELLRAVLTHHVLAGQVKAAQVKPGTVKTVNGSDLALSSAGAFVTVEDAVVQQADVQASNGVVHVIDRVLIPPVKR